MLSSAPQGRLLATVSIIKAYKDGGLTITQAGETMTVKLVLMCKTCPVLRRGKKKKKSSESSRSYIYQIIIFDAELKNMK